MILMLALHLLDEELYPMIGKRSKDGKEVSISKLSPEEPTVIHAALPDLSMSDYPDERSAVFFTSGCNFRCNYCYNRSLMHRQKEALLLTDIDKILKRFKKSWISAVVLTGGEPLIYAKSQLLPFLKLVKSKKLLIKLDTNGVFPNRLRSLYSFLDYIAIDIKASPTNYKKITGVKFDDQLQATLEFLIPKKKGSYELRTTIIEGFHTVTEMKRIGEFIRGAKQYILQPFIPDEDVLDPKLRNHPQTTTSYLNEMAAAVEPYVKNVKIRGV